MANTTYYLRNTVSDLSGGADFNYSLLNAPGTGSTLSISVAGSATEDSYAFTPAGTPSALDDVVAASLEIEVTSSNSNVNLSAAVARVNSAGVVQATSPFAAEQTASANTVYTFSIPAPALGSWQAGDRLCVVYRLRATNSMSQSITLGIGTAQAVISFVPPASGMMLAL